MESKIVFDRGIVEKTIIEETEKNVFIEKFIYHKPYDKYMKIAEAELESFLIKKNIEFYIIFDHKEFKFNQPYDYDNKELNIRKLIDNFLTDLNTIIGKIKN